MDIVLIQIDKSAAEEFLHLKGIVWSQIRYDFSGYSVNKNTNIYNMFIADEKWYVKVHEGVVIEWYEVTPEFGGFGVSRDLVSSQPLDWYEDNSTIRELCDYTEITKHPMSGDPTVTRYYKSEPPTRGALPSDYQIVMWSPKASGDIVIEYRKYKN